MRSGKLKKIDKD